MSDTPAAIHLARAKKKKVDKERNLRVKKLAIAEWDRAVKMAGEHLGSYDPTKRTELMLATVMLDELVNGVDSKGVPSDSMAGLSKGDFPWPVKEAYQQLSLILAAMNLDGSTLTCSPAAIAAAAAESPALKALVADVIVFVRGEEVNAIQVPPSIAQWDHAVIKRSNPLALHGRNHMIGVIVDESLDVNGVVVANSIVAGSAAADLAYNLLGAAITHTNTTSPFYDEVDLDLVDAVAGAIEPKVVVVISFAAVAAEKLRKSSLLPDKTTSFNTLVIEHVRARCADTGDTVPKFNYPGYAKTMLQRELAGWCDSEAFKNMLESCALDERFGNVRALADIDIEDDKAVETAIAEAAATTKASFLANLRDAPSPVPLSLKRKARRPLSELTDVEFAALMKRRL